MSRTNAFDVKQIIETDLPDEVINSYITSANAIVSNLLTGKLNEILLTEIEKWLTAHLIAATREQQIKQAGAAGTNVIFQGNTDGIGLIGTMYGQQVLILDSTGIMKKSFAKQASIFNVPVEDWRY